MTDSTPIFRPLISRIQKVALYETKSKIYLVGSNNQETKFRILTIDRTKCGDDLVINENSYEYSALEIRRFLTTLGSSVKVTSAYGILGFVRFLEGYYLILVTKRKCCAHIGMHLIYTVKDTVMVRVNEFSSSSSQQTSAPPPPPHPLEERYKRIFQSIDLRCNFYFSYSYDLTRSLQYNESHPRYVGPYGGDVEKCASLPDWNTLTRKNNIDGMIGREEEREYYAFRSNSRKRFVWNSYLMEPMENIAFRDWVLDITHGYVKQSCISVFGRCINVCIIARRSTRFAGTRYLKRGSNFQGDVANEVETEQIVTDGQRMCSYTQMRGSVPTHWSQDISKMVPKPPIQMDLCDPYAQTPGRHFERLFFHFGAPLIVLNLVKKREKRKHESIISKEMLSDIRYLNQFLPPPHRIKHIHFDMARKSRGGDRVMDQLADIAEYVVQQTGIFFKALGYDCKYQNGIIRINCIDCLDRTNTAQFAIGKTVLGHQLECLGFLKSAKLEFDSDCVTMLEQLYEEHGDTLALQYGGSQLVHRIKTYRKTAAWASHGNDIMQALSRYYSNTFSDTEKQQSINLFLGYYRPFSEIHTNENQPIWELQTDYHLHKFNGLQSHLMSSGSGRGETGLITDWLHQKIRDSLPVSCSDSNKTVKEFFRLQRNHFEMIDSYSNYYQSFKWTDLNEHISFELKCQLAMRSLPKIRTHTQYSPFKRQLIERQVQAGKNSSSFAIGGESSTSSKNSTSSSETYDSSTEEEISANSFATKMTLDKKNVEEQNLLFTLESILRPMNDVYGCKIVNCNKSNISVYKKYVQMGKLSNAGAMDNIVLILNVRDTSILLEPLNYYGQHDSHLSVGYPIVSDQSQNIYKEYCEKECTIFP